MTPLLDVHDLRVSFATVGGPVQAVDGVSFALGRGEVLAIVGESGSGKSACAMTLMGLTRGPNTTIAGSARLEGRELIGASESELRRIRGARMAMVFQDPQSSLNPVHRVGDQIAEQIRAHEPLVSKAQALDRAGELMERARIPRARERVCAYPHELSGGMRQRVMIAMALSLGAKALLADEPTTALDVTVQAQILAQLKDLRDQEELGIVLITHDFGVVADIADRIAVMRAGRIVEQGAAREIFHEPKNPYTRRLLEALQPSPTRRPARAREQQPPTFPRLPQYELPLTSPRLPQDEPPSRSPQLPQDELSPRAPQLPDSEESPPTALHPPGGEPLLVVEGLKVTFPSRGRRAAPVAALDGVSLAVGAGETLAIVGESGCGKTTLLRSIACLVEPTEGAIRLQGQDLARASRRKLALLRRELGMVFQDPQASLNPRRRVGGTLERALRARTPAREGTRLDRTRLDQRAPSDAGADGNAGADRNADVRLRAARLLERVGLKPEYAARFPHELSGGERQRVGIARALAGEPRLVLLDEPVSSLDASIRRGVIELLDELQAELGCGYVLVSHDFTTVEAVADRIAVMHGGKVVELAGARELLEAPAHPYTRELLAACPLVPFRVRLPGGVRSDTWADKETLRERDGSPRRETRQPGGDEPPATQSSQPGPDESPTTQISPRTRPGSFRA